jgi:hypothetical protein
VGQKGEESNLSTKRQSSISTAAAGQIGLFPFLPILNPPTTCRSKNVAIGWEFVFHANDPARWLLLSDRRK